MTGYPTNPEDKNNIGNDNIENIENIENVENVENVENIKKRILSALGLAARAGALVCGTDMICDVLRKTPEGNRNSNNRNKKVLLVIEASDTSDNTHKKLTDKCSYYKTEHIKTDNIDAATLAHAVGKSGGIAAVALTDQNFVKLFKKVF